MPQANFRKEAVCRELFLRLGLALKYQLVPLAGKHVHM